MATMDIRPAAIRRFSGPPAADVLADEDFAETPHVRFVAELAERLGIDLSATVTVMSHLPLWTAGQEHADLRRDTAAFLNRDRASKTRRAEAAIRARFDRHVIAAGPEVDLMAFLQEATADFLEPFTGLRRRASGIDPVLSLFSSNLGVAARRRLDAAIRAQMAEAEARFPDDDPRTLAIRVGQWWMGYDGLLGTFGQSLHRHLSRLDGGRLDRDPMPAIPTDTGVPMIGRIARTDKVVAGCPVSAGQQVECGLDGFNDGTEADRLRFFGAGRHLCLGRPMALDFCRIMADLVNGCGFGLKVTAYRKADSDVFDMPVVFTACKVLPG